METLIILGVIVMFIVIVLLLAKQKLRLRDRFSIQTSFVGKCVIDQNFRGTNPHIKYLVPDIEPLHLNSNQAMVVYGHIPYKYLLWSLSGYAVTPTFRSLGGCISSSRLQGQNNDGVAGILCTNRKMFKLVEDHVHQMWRLENPTYKLTVLPIYIEDPQCLCTLGVKIGIRHPDDGIPEFKFRVYTSPDIETPGSMSGESGSSMSNPPASITEAREFGLIHPHTLKASLEEVLKRGQFEVVRELEMTQVIDNDEVLKFRSPLFTLEEDQQVVALGIDHSKASKSGCSMITAYTADHCGLKTILTGDLEIRGIPQKSGVRVGFFDLNVPHQTMYLEEAIYPEMVKGQKLGVSQIHPMRGFVCQRF